MDTFVYSSFMGFGAGRRACLGETLARNRLFLFTAALLQKYRFKPDPDSELPSCDPRGYKGEFLSVPPAYKVKVEYRNV